jgi:hypothetical protein
MDQEQVPEVTPPTQAASSSKTKWIIVGVIALVVVAMGQLFSPERMVERAIENTYDGVDVDINRDGSVEYAAETDGGKVNVSAGDNVKLPAEWPTSIPILESAKLTYAGSVREGESSTGISVTFETEKSITDVMSFYSDMLVQHGWTIVQNMSAQGGAMLMATQGEDNAVTVNASSDGAITSVVLVTRVQ